MELDKDLHRIILKAAGAYFTKKFLFKQSLKLTTTLTVVIDSNKHYQYSAFDEIKSGETWMYDEQTQDRQHVDDDIDEQQGESTIDATDNQDDAGNDGMDEEVPDDNTDSDTTYNFQGIQIPETDTVKTNTTKFNHNHHDEATETTKSDNVDINEATQISTSGVKTSKDKQERNNYSTNIPSLPTFISFDDDNDDYNDDNGNETAVYNDTDDVHPNTFRSKKGKKRESRKKQKGPKDVDNAGTDIETQNKDIAAFPRKPGNCSLKQAAVTRFSLKSDHIENLEALTDPQEVNESKENNDNNADNELPVDSMNGKSMKIKTDQVSESSRVFRCEICDKNFKSRKTLRNHNNEKHGASSLISYHCDQCDKTFTRKDSLFHHQRHIHAVEKSFKCTEPGCDKSFNFHHSLKLHKLKHSGDRPYKCSTCDKTYLTAHHLKVHIAGAHSVMNDYVCKTCGKSFSYSNSLRVHEATHTSKVRVPCDECDKTFVNDQALRYHKMSKHVVSGKFECEICNKVYRSELQLKAHLRRHTSDSKRFMCDLCGKQYMYKSALEMHKSVHRDYKSHTCKVCGKGFRTYAALYSHMFVHKEDSPFICEVCNKAFKTKERLKAHARRHTGSKPFECTICKHRFPDKGGLSKHTKTVHCPSKKFVCNICGKSTTRADNLRVHMKIHNKGNVKPAIIVEESKEDTDILPSTVPLVIDTDRAAIKTKPAKKPRKPRGSVKVPNQILTAIHDLAPEIRGSGAPASYQANMPHFSTIDSSQLSHISSNARNSQQNSTNNVSLESHINGIPSHIANENLVIIETEQIVETTAATEAQVPSTVTTGSISVTPMQPVGYLYPWSHVYVAQQTGNSQGFYQQ